MLAFCSTVPIIARPMAEPEEQEQEQDHDVWIKMQAWVETHRKQIGMAFVAALIAGFGVYTNSFLQAQKRHDAESALLDLNRRPSAGGEVQATPASDYLKVSEEFAGTRVSERALLLAASALFTENKYDAAEKRFTQFLNEHVGSPHVNQARLGVASSLDAMNKFDEAVASYERLIAAAPGSSEASQAKIGTALIHEHQGQTDKALKLYDELIRAEPPTIWRGEASLRRGDLLKRHPQLTPSVTPLGGLPTIPTPLLLPGTNAAAKKVSNTNAAISNAVKAIIGTNSAPKK